MRSRPASSGPPRPCAGNFGAMQSSAPDPFLIRAHVPDFEDIGADYLAMSAAARSRWPHVRDVPYGPGVAERLNLLLSGGVASAPCPRLSTRGILALGLEGTLRVPRRHGVRSRRNRGDRRIRIDAGHTHVDDRQPGPPTLGWVAERIETTAGPSASQHQRPFRGRAPR